MYSKQYRASFVCRIAKRSLQSSDNTSVGQSKDRQFKSQQQFTCHIAERIRSKHSFDSCLGLSPAQQKKLNICSISEEHAHQVSFRCTCTSELVLDIFGCNINICIVYYYYYQNFSITLGSIKYINQKHALETYSKYILKTGKVKQQASDKFITEPLSVKLNVKDFV